MVESESEPEPVLVLVLALALAAVAVPGTANVYMIVETPAFEKVIYKKVPHCRPARVFNVETN